MNTVNAQLNAVFAKTDSHSQRALTRTMLTMLTWLAVISLGSPSWRGRSGLE